MHIYKKIGITNTTLKINSIGDPESRDKYKEALKDYFRPHINQLSDISRKRLEKNPLRILDSKEEEDQPFIANAPLIGDYLNKKSTVHFEKVKNYLDELDAPYNVDQHLVRGLDYYTRTAFELTSPNLGSQDALAGGGRYDLLIEELGGKSTPAVGFAAGIERLMIACEELGIELSEPKKVDVYIVTLGEDARGWGVKTLPILREAGLSATMDYMGRSMKAQMKDANRENAKFAIIVGDHELESGNFTFRDMEKSEESSLSFDQILKKLSD